MKPLFLAVVLLAFLAGSSYGLPVGITVAFVVAAVVKLTWLATRHLRP